MCELLVKARHTLTADAEKNKGIWRRGDIIVVEEDGYAWGIQERKTNWVAAGNAPSTWHKQTFLVKIPGVPKAKAVAMLQDQQEDVADTDEQGNLITRRKMVRRRIRHLAIDATPTQVRNAIGADYEITVTPLQIRNYLRDKDTDTKYNLGI